VSMLEAPKPGWCAGPKPGWCAGPKPGWLCGRRGAMKGTGVGSLYVPGRCRAGLGPATEPTRTPGGAANGGGGAAIAGDQMGAIPGSAEARTPPELMGAMRVGAVAATEVGIWTEDASGVPLVV
jgi:hypothetical protein